MSDALRNWAGNYTFSTANVLYQATIDEVVALVKQHPKLRLLGTRHTFNGIADSDAALMSLARLSPSVRFDHKRRQITISANMSYGELCPILHEAGYALPNMASLPHISVIGACMTATHGSGTRNPALTVSVTALTFVAADGALVTLSSGQDEFYGAVVSLGALGVVVELTLDLIPAFEISQHVYLDLPDESLETYFYEIMRSAYSVSLFTNWQGSGADQVWLKHDLSNSLPFPHGADFFGARAADREMHPIGELSPDACTRQLGVPGPWHERLPHFRIDATPSAGNELQSEYFVSAAHALDAIRAVHAIGDQISPHLLVSEIRTIADDRFWMSPFYNQQTVAIHFTWKQDWPAVSKVLLLIEAALEPFDARPHWGKLFTMQPSRLQSLYPNLLRFRELLGQYDPHGKFRNIFLQNYLYAED